MSINTVIIFCFILMLIVIAVLYRDSTLDKLEVLAGESALFEEQGVRVEQSGSPRSTVFFNCIVRVTDMRIIIAQKILLRKKHVLRHVIFFTESGDNTDLKKTFRKGYLLMRINSKSIHVEPDRAGSAKVVIKIPPTPLTIKQYITYTTKRAGDYMKIRDRAT